MLHVNLNAAHHLTSSLILLNLQKILKNPQNGFFKGSNGCHTDESYEAEVLAVVKQQYLPKFLPIVPNPAHGNFLSFSG